jgi:predicted AAA+ superfamily ATPase
MEILVLYPLAQSEIERKEPDFLFRLFHRGFKVRRYERLGAELLERIAGGGYPPALRLPPGRRRMRWYRSYLETIIQRDMRDLTRIRSLDLLPRLLMAAASQTAHLLNVSELSSPFQISRPTVRDYITLFARLFLLEELPPWHSHRLSRLVKTPKLHITDTGVACALLGVDPRGRMADRTLLGQLLETFVFQELKRQASWYDDPLAFYHFRDRDGYEVDIVIEQGIRALAGIEVKAGATVTEADFRGLRRLKEAVKDRFVRGVVLYDGETSVRFGESLYAVPLRALWEPE